jgi:hypothetical protein
MAVLGTTTADDAFYQRKAAQAGQAIAMFAESLEARKREKERREREEIAAAFKAMEIEPEFAKTWGQDLVKRYGARYPEVGHLVSLFQNKAKLAARIPAAGKRWEEEWENLERSHQEKQQTLRTLPDWVQVPAGGGPVPSFLTLPNPEKGRLAQELSSVAPGLFPVMAAQALTPRERMLARLYAKSQGFEMPAEFDPFGDDLPPQTKAVLAAQLGLITGDTAKAGRIGAGLEVAPAEQARWTQETSERLGREKHENAAREDEQTHALDYLTKDDRLTRERDNLRTANEKSVISLRESLGGDGGNGKKELPVSADDLIDYGKFSGETWDKLWAQKNAGSGSDKKAARAEFLQNNGFRPSVPPTSARAIATRLNKAVEAGLMDEETAQRESTRLTSEYMHLTSNLQGRMTHPQALNRILDQIPAAQVTDPNSGRPAPGAPRAEKPARPAAASQPMTAEKAAEAFRKELRARHPRATPDEIEKKVDAAMSIWMSRQGGGG